MHRDSGSECCGDLRVPWFVQVDTGQIDVVVGMVETPQERTRVDRYAVWTVWRRMATAMRQECPLTLPVHPVGVRGNRRWLRLGVSVGARLLTSGWCRSLRPG